MIGSAARSLVNATLIVLLVSVAMCTDALALSLSKLFSKVGDFPLGAGTTRTDYESLDPGTRRLYIAKMGAGQVLVFDIDTNNLVKQLDGYPKVTGVLAVPEIHKIYASVPGGGLISSIAVGLGMAALSSGRGTIAVIDTQSLRETVRLQGGVFPDGITYDPRDHRVFVSDELGSALTVIDANADRVVARIATGGEVGNVRYDAATRKIYVPVQSHNELIAVDPATGKIVWRHATTGCEHPHGFIIAPGGGIGYVACDENDQLLTIELTTGRVLARLPVARDPDVLALDAPARRLYVASESGGLSTFDISVPKAPMALGDVFVGKDAHAVAVDEVTHRLFLALASLDGRAVLRELAPRP